MRSSYLTCGAIETWGTHLLVMFHETNEQRSLAPVSPPQRPKEL